MGNQEEFCITAASVPVLQPGTPVSVHTGALRALRSQADSKCLLGYLLPASIYQVCSLSLTLCSYHTIPTASLVMGQCTLWILDKEQADGIVYMLSAPLQQTLQQL